MNTIFTFGNESSNMAFFFFAENQNGFLTIGRTAEKLEVSQNRTASIFINQSQNKHVDLKNPSVEFFTLGM